MNGSTGLERTCFFVERQNAAHLLVEELNQWVIVLEVEGLKGRARKKITAR